ncbi:transglycosylase SLT domain-containing protein, partial [Klebsiella pneumoniae]|uniref:transglycosylase SLT domain-containing protein n=1 Tax=Klebsiella pneumoniae TaxID=573 RepID=UPI0013A5891C
MAQNDFFTTAADRALAEQPSFGLPEFAKTERAPSSIPAGGAVPFQDVFNAAAQRYGVPVNVLMALGEQESRFNPTALGVPTKYGRAKGLMQYIDSTAAGMGINPYDPVQSIDAAARQLRDRLAKGYSMQEAVSAHFAGDDRKQWGPKTAVYGQEVLARAEKFLNGGKASVTQPTPGQQQNAAQPFDMSQEREAYPAAQSAMENMDQTRLRTQALLDEMNKEEPGRYRALTPDELAQLQQQAQGQQNQQPQEKVGNTDPTPLTTPGELPQGNKDGNLLLDSAILLTSGLNTAAKDAKELVSRIPYIGKPIVDAADRFDRWANGKGSEEIFKEWDKNVEASLSPAMVQARKSAWVVEPGDDLGNGKKATSYSFGPAWSDPRAYMSGILESLPEMAVTMGGAGRLASMSYKAALRAGASREVAAKAAARTATVAGGLLEGGLGGAQSAREVRDDINKMTPDQLKDSDALKAIMAQGKSFEQARSELAENAATRAFIVAGIGTGLFGGMGDRAIAKVVTNRAGGRIRSAITGAIGEGLFEEVPQSVLQQGGQNYALQEADPSIPLTKGVANAAGGGLAIGATMGAGIGAAAPRAGTNEVNPQPEAAPVDTVDPTPARLLFTSHPAAAPTRVGLSGGPAPVTADSPLH